MSGFSTLTDLKSRMSGFSTLTDLMHYVLASYRNSTHLNFWVKDTWQIFSTEKFIENVRRASLGLYQIGIKKGDSVGILAQSSPSWLVADMAIMVNGAVTVPMFTYLSKKNFDYQVQDANLKALFVLGKDAWHSFENKLKIDIVEFDKCLNEQKNRSKIDAVKQYGDWIVLKQDDVQEFVGYDHSDAKIIITKYRSLVVKGETKFQLIFNLFLINQRHIKEGITIIVVKIKKTPQSPFNQSTRAPEDEARVVLPAVPIDASKAY